MVSTEGDVPNLTDISMVPRFSGVFLEDLPGLPSVRELELGIDLAVVTRPISSTIYSLTPIEPKELEKSVESECFE